MTMPTNYHSIARQICISVFAIFIGSQITEGALLVPYWQSLSAEEFYSYYAEFGPAIGRFYTILTVIAALIPVAVSVSCVYKKRAGAMYAITSSIFAMLFILAFYVYFKGTNEGFYQRAFSEIDLAKELIVWSNWHWSRIALEIVSLLLLIMAFGASSEKEGSK